MICFRPLLDPMLLTQEAAMKREAPLFAAVPVSITSCSTGPQLTRTKPSKTPRAPTPPVTPAPPPEAAASPPADVSGEPIASAVDKLLLTEREAAQALSISPRKLWELRATGEIPCVRLGRAVRYDPRDLSAWITRRRTTE